eukprot:TRINITY_DN54137_c0_g1_i1.p1 TRINITY_DN54137_c0_g1~~TRINITY_DN54137_c0_g1_i1.p1  ORF type:complete len:1174 (-),score=180.42 TRINITY_DN54137_c0_g1_i1:154-3675(-)
MAQQYPGHVVEQLCIKLRHLEDSHTSSLARIRLVEQSVAWLYSSMGQTPPAVVHSTGTWGGHVPYHTPYHPAQQYWAHTPGAADVPGIVPPSFPLFNMTHQPVGQPVGIDNTPVSEDADAGARFMPPWLQGHPHAHLLAMGIAPSSSSDNTQSFESPAHTPTAPRADSFSSRVPGSPLVAGDGLMPSLSSPHANGAIGDGDTDIETEDISQCPAEISAQEDVVTFPSQPILVPPPVAQPHRPRQHPPSSPQQPSLNLPARRRHEHQRHVHASATAERVPHIEGNPATATETSRQSAPSRITPASSIAEATQTVATDREEVPAAPPAAAEIRPPEARPAREPEKELTPLAEAVPTELPPPPQAPPEQETEYPISVHRRKTKARMQAAQSVAGALVLCVAVAGCAAGWVPQTETTVQTTEPATDTAQGQPVQEPVIVDSSSVDASPAICAATVETRTPSKPQHQKKPEEGFTIKGGRKKSNTTRSQLPKAAAVPKPKPKPKPSATKGRFEAIQPELENDTDSSDGAGILAVEDRAVVQEVPPNQGKKKPKAAARKADKAKADDRVLEAAAAANAVAVAAAAATQASDTTTDTVDAHPKAKQQANRKHSRKAGGLNANGGTQIRPNPLDQELSVRVESLLSRAQELQKLSQFREALGELAQALVLSKGLPLVEWQCRMHTACVYLMLTDNARAKPHLDVATTIAETHGTHEHRAQVYLFAGLLASAQRKCGETEKLFSKAQSTFRLTRDPNAEEDHFFQAAEIARQRGDYFAESRALNAIYNMERRSPKIEELYGRLAYCYNQLEDSRSLFFYQLECHWSIAHGRRPPQLLPPVASLPGSDLTPDHLFNVAQDMEKRNQLEEALLLYQRALDGCDKHQAPTAADCCQHIAVIRRHQGDYLGAARSLQRRIELLSANTSAPTQLLQAHYELLCCECKIPNHSTRVEFVYKMIAERLRDHRTAPQHIKSRVRDELVPYFLSVGRQLMALQVAEHLNTTNPTAELWEQRERIFSDDASLGALADAHRSLILAVFGDVVWHIRPRTSRISTEKLDQSTVSSVARRLAVDYLRASGEVRGVAIVCDPQTGVPGVRTVIGALKAANAVPVGCAIGLFPSLWAMRCTITNEAVQSGVWTHVHVLANGQELVGVAAVQLWRKTTSGTEFAPGACIEIFHGPDLV